MTRHGPPPPLWVSYSQEALGRHRIATTAQYEVYRGTDASPDFTAAPYETFTSLPHDTAVQAASHTYHFVLRYRNEHNLLSQNIEEWVLEVDAGQDAVATRPTDPTDVSVVPAAAGAVTVQAYYNYEEDGDDQATQFLVYLTSDGSNPVPGVDTPTAVAMVKSDGIAKLDWDSTTLADGLTIKVIVQVRRIDSGPTNIDSLDATIYSTTSDTDGPAAPEGGIFFDETAEQEQA